MLIFTSPINDQISRAETYPKWAFWRREQNSSILLASGRCWRHNGPLYRHRWDSDLL